METSWPGLLYPPTDVMLSDNDVVQPDLIFVSRAREHIITEAKIQGAPDLVVEILSPSTASRDWRDKLDLYERHGVAEYWLVDPVSEIVWVFRLVDGALAQVGMYGEGDTPDISVAGGVRAGPGASIRGVI